MRTILKLIFLLSLLLFVVAPPAEASVRSLSSVRCPWVVAPVTFTYDGCKLVYDASKQPKYDYDQSSILIASEKGNQPTGNFAFFAAFPKLVAAKTPLWTSTKAKTGVENAFGHWQKHGAEFPEFQNAKQYVEGAKDFFSKPPSGTLTKPRPNGDTLFYNPGNNTFGVQAADGAPRTMFRPTDGINYWNKQ